MQECLSCEQEKNHLDWCPETPVIVEFQGQRYLFVGDTALTDGALTSRPAFEHMLPSFAHLYSDGRVMRYGVAVGTREDIKVVGELDLAHDDEHASEREE